MVPVVFPKPSFLRHICLRSQRITVCWFSYDGCLVQRDLPMPHTFGTLLAASTTDVISAQSFFDRFVGSPCDCKVIVMTAKSVLIKFIHSITPHRCTNVVWGGID